MIRVDIKSNEDGFIDMQIKGHASSSLCSAISALTQSSVNYMVDLSKKYPEEIKVKIEHIERGLQ